VTHDVLDEEQETLAALYALDSLGPEEARAFARHLDEDGCAVCRAQVEAMTAVGDDLALAPAAAAPSAAVRRRLLGRIAGDASLTFAFTLAQEGDWTEIQPGVLQKTLIAARPGDPSSSYLVRIAPTTRVAAHEHACFEHCYVISGDLFIAGRHIRSGDYHYAPPGSVHDHIRSDDGCLLLIVEAR
jgi:anti-sigma factor ChrR (cupin superfamily)